MPAPGDGGGDSLQPATCPDGSALVQYSLTPPASTPGLGALELPGLHPATIVAPAKDGVSDSMRFDLCQGAGGVELHAILLRSEAVGGASRYVVDATVSAVVEDFVDVPEGRVFQVRVPRAVAVVEGLAAALAGNLRPLRVRMPGENGLLVMGHAGFLAVARGRVDAASIEYTSLYVLVGGLAPGNVFANLRCPFGEMPLSRTFHLDSARFDVEGCSFLGGGFTTGYRIDRLRIHDANVALQEAHRNPIELASKAEVDAALTYKWNHHNACDSFHLALPHADYAASSSPAAGCGPQVPNAPPRRIDEPFDSPVLFKIRYYGGAWREGTIPGCNHYLFCR